MCLNCYSMEMSTDENIERFVVHYLNDDRNFARGMTAKPFKLNAQELISKAIHKLNSREITNKSKENVEKIDATARYYLVPLPKKIKQITLTPQHWLVICHLASHPTLDELAGQFNWKPEILKNQLQKMKDTGILAEIKVPEENS